MRRFAVRQRPLQPSKRIRVYHLSADGSFISETGERVIASLYDLDDCVSGFTILVFVMGNRRQHFCGLVRSAGRNNVAKPIPPDCRFPFFSDFALLLKLTVVVVTRKSIVLDKGPHFHSQAPHQHSPQLRL